MTPKQEAALRLAREVLKMWWPMTATYLNARDEAVAAIDEALAEQQSGIKQVIELYDSPEQPVQQEPDKYLLEVECTKCGATEKAVLTFTPQSKPWVGLEESEWREIDDRNDWTTTQGRIDASEEIEAKLKEKNT
jgi:hypothetical protein